MDKMQEHDQMWVSKYMHDKCPKISYTKVSDKMAYANSADPDQTDQGLHCLPFQ